MRIIKNVSHGCLVAFLIFSSATPSLYAAKKSPSINKEEIQINFENVSMIEFLKFVSKVADLNVIYNPEELNFNVTIVSKEATSVDNVLSALVQVLRIHGFSLIEEEQNLIIHTNPSVKQIPTVVSKEHPLNPDKAPVIMTRVFKIRKANPTALAALLTPMLSKDALVEVSIDSRQLIITDVASSIKTIEDLLLSLDVPDSPYEVGIYAVKNMQPTDLVALAKQILTPMAGTNHIDLFGQNFSNSVYIVSTPFLIEKANAVLQEIDKEAANVSSAASFLIYNIKDAREEQIQEALTNLADHLEATHSPNKDLITTIDSLRWIKSSNSLLFTGPPKALQEINTLLPSFDVPISKSQSLLTQASPSTEFVLYTPKFLTATDLKSAIGDMAKSLRASELSDPSFLRTLETTRLLTASNQLVFTGDPASLKRLQEILADLDQENSSIIRRVKSGSTVLFVPLTNRLAPDIVAILKETSQKLAGNKNSSPTLIQVLDSAQALTHSNTVIISGETQDVQKVKDLIASNDVPTSTTTVIFVPLTNRSASDILAMLRDTAKKLNRFQNTPPAFLQTLQTAESSPDDRSILLTGSVQDVAKVKELILSHDMNGKGSDVYVYKLKYIPASELKNALSSIAENTLKQGNQDETQDLTKTINSLNILPDMGTVQFVGTTQSIEKLKEILLVIDTADYAKLTKIPQGSNFLTYKVQNMSPQELLTQVKQLVQDSVAVTQDQNLLRTVRGGRYIKDSHSLVFTGRPEELDKLQKLLVSLDVGNGPLTASARVAATYKMYKPQIVPGPELIRMVRAFQDHLTATGVVDQSLKDTIDHLSYVNQTNTVIISGSEEEITKVYDLLKEFDTSSSYSGKVSNDEMETINDTGFLVVKLQNQSGAGIVDALNAISRDLAHQKNQTKNANLIEAIQSVQWIEMTNSLLATGDPDVLKRLRELIEMIDRPLKQVFIEILVLETSTANQFNLGLRYGLQGKVNNKLGWGLGNYPITDGNQGFPKNFNDITATNVPTGSDIPPIPGGFLGAIGDIIWHNGKSYASLGSLIDAFKADADTTIVLSQRIIAQDNQNAKIFSGDNVPFTGSLVTTSGLSQTTNANLEYRNIGVTVSLTPIIGDNGLITLDIDEEISEETNLGNGNTNVSTNTLNGIRTTKTSAQTRVTMMDQYFLILCGTIRNQSTRVVSGVPCLGGLPLIGAAFNQNQKLTVSHNVVIFIRPHIIPTQEFYSELTKGQEELFGNKELSNTDDYYKMLEILRAPDAELDTTPDTEPRSHISRLLP
jgi:type III secretion protein C